MLLCFVLGQFEGFFPFFAPFRGHSLFSVVEDVHTSFDRMSDTVLAYKSGTGRYRSADHSEEAGLPVGL
jgi:hypothetical protein